jgi:hypothetical protein
LFTEPHFIGMLKFTVTLVSTSTFIASAAGLIDSTSGRGLSAAAAAGAPAAHTINISAAIEIRLTRYFNFIVPTGCRSGIRPTPRTQGMCLEQGLLSRRTE